MLNLTQSYFEEHIQVSCWRLSCSRFAAEKEVDERVAKLAEEAYELDEPDILLDLRRLNGKPNATEFYKF